MYPRNSHNKTIFGATPSRLLLRLWRPKPGTSKAGIDQFSLPFSKRSLEHPESLCDFALQLVEIRGQRRPLRIDDHVDGDTGRKSTQPNGFAQTALDAVPLDRAAKCLAHCKANTQTPQVLFRFAEQVKHREVRRKMSSPLLVNSLKVRVPQQSTAFRKLFRCVLLSGVGQIRLQSPGLGFQKAYRDCRFFKLRPKSDESEIYCSKSRGPERFYSESLFAKSRLYRNSFAPFGSAPGNHRASALGLHTGAKAVRLRTVAAVRLECTFRHEKSLALLSLASAMLNLSEVKV